MPSIPSTRVLTLVLDGAGSAIAANTKRYLSVPFNATIKSWRLVADQSGSIVIDVWKDTYANFPPTVADTIAGSEKPTLSTATKSEDTDLTTWQSLEITQGDVLGFNVDSITTITVATLQIIVEQN